MATDPMNPSVLILATAGVGLVVNTIAVLGVAWRGGQLLGRMSGTMDQLSSEVRMLREDRDEHSVGLTRAIEQLVSLDRRVQRIEGREDA